MGELTAAPGLERLAGVAGLIKFGEEWFSDGVAIPTRYADPHYMFIRLVDDVEVTGTVSHPRVRISVYLVPTSEGERPLIVGDDLRFYLEFQAPDYGIHKREQEAARLAKQKELNDIIARHKLRRDYVRWITKYKYGEYLKEAARDFETAELIKVISIQSRNSLTVMTPMA